MNEITSDTEEYLYHNEALSNEGNENDLRELQSSTSNKKVYQRHTPEQIQRLEELFRVCPQPIRKDRIKLGEELGMTPLRVKFWFQNRRTQIKNKNNRLENEQLKVDNERIRQENVRLKRDLHAMTCTKCGSKAHQGTTEKTLNLFDLNEKLREKINEATKMIEQFYPAGPCTTPYVLPEVPSQGITLGVDLQAAINLAEAAAGELLAMARVKDPLWMPIGPDGTEILNEKEYNDSFDGGNIGPRPLGFAMEATRAVAMISSTNVYKLIELFMDTSKWAAFFFEIVSSARTIEVLSRGTALSEGTMQVISAEFQLPTPLVPLRECCFLRYYKKLSDGRTWIIVDVSLDSLLQPMSIPNCRRRPSGCVIQEMPNKLLMVTWVEHVEVDYRSMNEIFNMMVSCGMAFGARRCLAILDRQLERNQFVMSQNSRNSKNISFLICSDVSAQVQATTILRLAERIMIDFNCSAPGNSKKSWIPVSGTGEDNVRILGRVNNDDPGKPIGVIFCASTTFQMSLLPKKIFDFFLNDSTRTMWNILYTGGIFQKIADIHIGREESSCVSVYNVNGVQSSHDFDRETMFIQESCSDATGSYLIYAPISTVSMNILKSVGDPDQVPLLASGFSVFPDGPCELTGGSLVTVAFQIHVDSNPMMVQVSPQVITVVNNLVKATELKIKSALLGN